MENCRKSRAGLVPGYVTVVRILSWEANQRGRVVVRGQQVNLPKRGAGLKHRPLCGVDLTL